MANELMSLKATNGILNVFEDRVEISRKTGFGVLSQGIKGDRILFYKDLSSVEFKKPSVLANGYIKFIVTGTSDTNASVNLLGMTTTNSLKDPNTLILRAFNKQTPAESEKAYNIILKKVKEAKANSGNTVIQPVMSNADELSKYKNLLDQGVITQEEFDAKKKQLLAL
ncbi:MAG: SHOCT domain-containing protein [Eubacteriales bacterium]|nr:SHOCT domain-containing protein [Eubacteriales bacterium]